MGHQETKKNPDVAKHGGWGKRNRGLPYEAKKKKKKEYEPGNKRSLILFLGCVSGENVAGWGGGE